MIRTPIILLVVALTAVTDGRQAGAEPGSAPAKLGQAALMHDKIAGNWKKHTVTRLDPDRPNLKMPALFQYISDPWNRIALYPYMQYMPERHRLIAIVGCDIPHRQFLTISDDGGATWTGPRQIRDDVTKGLGYVCYFDGGRVMLMVGNPLRYCYSDDYGETFPHTVPIDNKIGGIKLSDSGIPFVDRNPKTGEIDRLIGIRYESGHERKPDQGYIHFSENLGRTWSADVLVPQWNGFNEAQMVRAQNGDLVCCLRTVIHERYKGRVDHFCGMGVSISKDNGETWSDVDIIYEWGRHHQSLVLMPNGDIVMSYVVREGYPPNVNGYPTFGVEAIVSHDHGQTWGLDQAYVLYEWDGHLLGREYWRASPQVTSTALLPDGDLITIFSTGEREIGYPGDPAGAGNPKRVGVVRWRLADLDL